MLKIKKFLSVFRLNVSDGSEGTIEVNFQDRVWL